MRRIGGSLIVFLLVFANFVFAKEFEFEYYAPKARKVNIAGEFNEWSKDKDEMTKDSDGYFRIKLDLSPGIYEYKYIVDGEWISGGNFIFNTYQGKTIRTSNFAWSPHIFWRGKFLVNVTSSSVENRHTVSGDVTLNRNVHGFFAVEASGNNDSGWNLKASKGYIAYNRGNFLLKPFYDFGLFQSKDPLKILRRESIPLRQERVEFYDERNIRKNFGLENQGIYSAFGNFEILATEAISSEEDVLYASFRKKFFGAEILQRKGIKFPYANSSNWFPDPEIPSTWLGSQNALLWYKGFNEIQTAEIDAEKKTKFADFFAEYCLENRLLRATRWNEEANKDIPIDRVWKFYRAKKVYSGFRLKLPVKVQYSYFVEQGKFSQFWNCSPAIEKHEIALRFDFGKSFAGCRYLLRKNKKIDGYSVDENFDPYRIFYYGDFSDVFFTWREIFLIFDVRGRTNSASFAGKYYPDKKLKEAVLSASSRVSFLSLEFSPRYFSFAGEKWVSYSASLGFVFGKLKVNAGTGMSPESFSLFDENDRREDFLYNGKSISQAEGDLKKQERLWLRIVLDF
ncbi:MAG: glycogen-binding domain-containing protein [Elusimicrobia bacterium]|nr:glycogen-binding domain-containing protein [Elusimicrobiota bacterium]